MMTFINALLAFATGVGLVAILYVSLALLRWIGGAVIYMSVLAYMDIRTAHWREYPAAQVMQSITRRCWLNFLERLVENVTEVRQGQYIYRPLFRLTKTKGGK